MIIAVDFDGTLCVDRYPSIGVPMPYAIGVMQQLADDGHYLIIYTCRESGLLIEAINWLLAHNIPFNRVNDNHPKATAEYGSNARKIFADLYVDDRNIHGFPGWMEEYEAVKAKDEQLKTEQL